MLKPHIYTPSLRAAKKYIDIAKVPEGWIVQLRIGTQSFILTPVPYDRRVDANSFADFARKGVAYIIATEAEKVVGKSKKSGTARRATA